MSIERQHRIVTSTITKKKEAQPMPDMGSMASVWSDRYQCRFFGKDEADCMRQIKDQDKRRKGERVVGPKSTSFTINRNSQVREGKP